jgi:hypothetical protein
MDEPMEWQHSLPAVLPEVFEGQTALRLHLVFERAHAYDGPEAC